MHRRQVRRSNAPAREPGSDRGVAIVLVLLGMLLLSALGMALALNTSIERQVSAAYSSSADVFYAADAALEIALQELSQVPDWNVVLTGAASTFVDGLAGPRVLPDGSLLDLEQVTDAANCGRSPCSMADMQVVTGARPWGANNPVWLLYAHAPLEHLSPGVIDSNVYVVVWVADDSDDRDGDPATDTNDVIVVHAAAFGIRGGHREVEATLRREEAIAAGLPGVMRTDVRLIAWRELR